MGTDRELLEKAAKAAGFTNFVYGELSGDEPVLYIREPDFCGAWSPLYDDGDALRLAVKLNMRIHIEADSAGCITIEWDFDEGGRARQSLSQEAPMGGDDYAATRRAIVRAAAAMPEGGQG